MPDLIVPKVFLVAKTEVVEKGLSDYLIAIGAPDWETDAPSGIELLLEVMGRLCYRAFGVDLNLNISKVREGNGDYIQNVAKQRHGSVFEHGSVTFILHNVSRVVTHELVRHRAGAAYSQESLRFVRLDKLLFWMPGAFKDHPKVQETILALLTAMEEAQVSMAEELDLDEEGTPFSVKKFFTSAMRRVAPMGLATTIGWTVNMRALRHVIEMRTSRHAEEEIRLVMGMVAEIAKKEFPYVFADMQAEEVNGYMEYTFLYNKI